MDAFTFLTLIIFNVTIIAIVAIVFGQNKIAEKAITGLTGILKNFTSKTKKQAIRKNFSKRNKKPLSKNGERPSQKPISKHS